MQNTYSSEKLVGLLDSTLNPSLRKQAEEELSLVIKIYFFNFLLKLRLNEYSFVYFI